MLFYRIRQKTSTEKTACRKRALRSCGRRGACEAAYRLEGHPSYAGLVGASALEPPSWEEAPDFGLDDDWWGEEFGEELELPLDGSAA